MGYDFYTMGIRRGREKLKDLTTNLTTMAEEIEEKYGADARMEFEMGVVVSVPVYSSSEAKGLTIGDVERGSNVYGVPNERNNSYFGGTGTSHQFVERGDTFVYNEPSGSKKK